MQIRKPHSLIQRLFKIIDGEENKENLPAILKAIKPFAEAAKKFNAEIKALTESIEGHTFSEEEKNPIILPSLNSIDEEGICRPGAGIEIGRTPHTY